MDIVIVGGGQAGFSVAARLRARGHKGRVTLLGEEPELPYERPPLSKAYLLGERQRAQLAFRPATFYAERDITLLTGHRVEEIDRTTARVRVGREQIPYDRLVLATGATPRLLPTEVTGGLAGVHVLRTLGDVDAIAAGMSATGHVLVVGGGYIGLEAAAAARKLGWRVTLIEAGERILQRVAGSATADCLRQLHRSHGVEIREATGLSRLEGRSGRVGGAILSDGSGIACDLVLVGIGVRPATELAEQAGLAVDNGIRVDARGTTSDAAIFAAGDCTLFPWRGRHVRLESVQNAVEQAECVADNLLGAGRDYDPVPWFWSDQYDAKLQIAGLCSGHDRVVRRGDGDSVSFWYYLGDTFLAVDAINDGRAYMAGKRLLERSISPDPERIADPSTDLKALLLST